MIYKLCTGLMKLDLLISETPTFSAGRVRVLWLENGMILALFVLVFGQNRLR